jgi:alcohol dehydrogenase (cytochrome c)
MHLRLPIALFLSLACSAALAGASTGDDWLTYNGSYAGDRYSTLAQINRSNVAGLHVVCAFQLGVLGPMQSGIVETGGTMYVTQDDDTFALDARTCRQRWKNSYNGPGRKSGIADRGVALLDGMLYRGTRDSHLIAIDAATGTTRWDVQVSDSSDGSATPGAPLAWQGKVFIGLAGSEFGVKGKIMAFSTADGHRLWTFDTIPTGDEPGANTWGRADTTATGGGSWWTSETLDPQTGTVFFPIGNPAPDYYADYRPGANLYTDSIVALDASTGKLRWYFQLVPNDYHDWDTTVPPIRFIAADGKPMFAFAGKDGYLFTMDATTHAIVAKVPVTTITNADKPFTAEGTYFCPNMGVEWNGPAYSPLAKLAYVNAVDWCSTIKLGEVRYVKGQSFLGSANGSGLRDPVKTGWLTAADPLSGKVAWKYHAPSPLVAGITVTAGGVLFTGEVGGPFDAFDAATGKLLYQFDTGGSVGGGVATYSVGGKQYVAVESGNRSRASLQGDGSAMVFVFSL